MSDQAEKDPAQVLEDAADLLLIHGRCRGDAVDAEGRYCVRGAIQAAQGNEPTAFGMPSAADRALDRWLGDTTFARDYLAESEARLPLISDDIAQAGSRRFIERCREQRMFPGWIWNDRLRGEEDDFEVIDTLRLVAKDLRGKARP